jgi:hypothetical protein
MKRIIVFLSLFFYLFLITSCKQETQIEVNSNNFESFYEVSYETIFEEDTFKVVVQFTPKHQFKVLEGDFELSIFLRSYDLDTIHVIEKNKTISFEDIANVIFRESIDEDILLIEVYDYAIKNAALTLETSADIVIQERTYETPQMSSYPLWFSIENATKNNEIYQEIDQKINAFRSNQNQFEYEILTYISMDDGKEVVDFSIDQQTLIQLSPLYLETDMEGIRQIITEMNQKMVLVFLSSEPDYNGYYLYSPIDLGDTIDNQNPTEDIHFDPALMRFSKLNNRLYHFITKASDYLTEEDVQEIEYLYGNKANQLFNNLYMQGQIEFANDYLMISYGLSMGDDDLQMKMMISMKMTKTEFTPIDLSDSSQYKLQAPTMIELASIPSPIDENIDGVMDGSGLYYKFELEKGSYIIESEFNTFGGMQYQLFNENYQEIYLGIVDSKTSMRSLGVNHEYVLIRESGTYYLKVSYAIYNNMFNFKLSKLDFDLLDNDHGTFISNNQTLSYELENAFDIYTVVFDIDQITGVKVTGTNIPNIIAKPFLHGSHTSFISDTTSKYFIISPENPIFIFMNPDLNSKETYNLTIELIEQTHTSTKDESKMEAITNLYNTKEIITGPGIPKAYMKLLITDEARYQFNFDLMYGVMEGELLSSDFTKISNVNHGSSADLLPGTYYVVFSNQYVSIGKIKYTKIDLNIQTIIHELALIPTPDLTNLSLPIIYGTLSNSLSRIYYQFTLDETSYVMLGKEHGLYNSQNEKISFDGIPYGISLTYQLEPGTYKVRINPTYYDFPQEYSLILAKIENPYIDDNHFGKNITNAYLNMSYEFKGDYLGDRDVMKLVITTRAQYLFYTNMQLVLCNSNRVNIDTIYAVWGGHSITLEPGTYYLVNYPSVNHLWTLTITA